MTIETFVDFPENMVLQVHVYQDTVPLVDNVNEETFNFHKMWFL